METNFDTLSQAMDAYNQVGYTEEFDTVNGKILGLNNKKEYAPEDLLIVNGYRFEGMSSTGDNTILYLIEANDGTLGTMVDNYGGSDPAQDPDLIRAIPVQEVGD